VGEPTGDQRQCHHSRPALTGRDDPGAVAAADVRAILARALGLRRLVELALEVGAGRTDWPAEASRSWPRPRPS
jgi:hypothetical protein